MADVLDRVKIWTPFDEAKITLATFDERGKCVQKVESHNYVTDILTGQIKWFTRQYITRRCGVTSPTNDSNNNPSYIEWMVAAGANACGYAPAASPALDYYPTSGQGTPGSAPCGVVLTTAAHAEDPTNDRFIRGAMTAWSYLEGFTGTETHRGSLNASECVVSPSKAVFVFDWPTSAGNGTAQSVYWANTLFTGNVLSTWPEMFLQNAAGTGYGSTSTPTWMGSQATGFTYYGSQRDVGLYLDPDGVSYWTLQPNLATGDCYMLKRTLGTGALVSSIRLNGSGFGVYGFTNDGSGSLGNWWTYDGGGNLKKWPAAGGTATSTTSYATLGIPQPYNGATFPTYTMFFYNGYIWLQSTPSGGPYRMYQILASGPTLAASVTIPSSPSGQPVGPNGTYAGLYYPDATNGDELWLSTVQYVNRYDLSGNWRGTFIPAIGSFYTGMSLYPGGGVMYSIGSFTTVPVQYNYIVNNCRQFHARSLLPSPVTKSNTQTMKLTYEFDYT
jgi:hypothetical protein